MQNPKKPSGADVVLNKSDGCDHETCIGAPYGHKSPITGGDVVERSANYYGKKDRAGSAVSPDINIIMTRINPYRPKPLKVGK